MSLIILASTAGTMPVYAEEHETSDIIVETPENNLDSGENALLGKSEDKIIKNDESGIPDKVLYDEFLSNGTDDNEDGVLTESELKGARTLYIQDENISTLSGIQYCTGMDTLQLTRCNITDFSLLKGLTELEYLALDSNSITDIEPVSNLVNLGILNIHGNSITKLPDLTRLTLLSPAPVYETEEGYIWNFSFAGNNITLDDAKVNLPAQLLENDKWMEAQGFITSEPSYEQQLKDKVAELESASLAEENYTSASWKAYMDALNYAKSILGKADATETEYKNALAELQKAREELVKAGDSETEKGEGTDTKKDSGEKVPQTGDTMNTMMILLLMFGSLSVLGIAGVKRKSK